MPATGETHPAAVPSSSKLDRSSNKRRVDCLVFPPSNRPLVPGPTRPESNSNKSLPSKMMSLHRKKRSNEVIEATHQANCPGSKSAMVKPKHLDLMEAVSQKEREARMKQRDGTAKPAVDIKQYNPEAYRTVAYNEYLTQAFGLKGAAKDTKPTTTQREAAKMQPDGENKKEKPVVLQKKDAAKAILGLVARRHDHGDAQKCSAPASLDDGRGFIRRYCRPFR
ncbi:MAG: hypothetical protein Q9183_000528 [Haloplaca sp. 2 TL-2023]